MKKFLALVLSIALCLGMVSLAQAEAAPVYKIGVLTPTSTHGWVSAITYHAEVYAKELKDAGKIEYNFYISSNAEEMANQIDDAMTWGAQALVIAPQWTGMEVPVQNAIDEGLVVVAFDMDIDAQGIYKVTGENEAMGVEGAKYIVNVIGTEGLVIAMTAPTQGSVNELRMKGFKETMAKIAPNVEIVEKANSTFSREVGLSVMADVLTAYDHIDAVFSLDDETSIGALQAIADEARDDIKAITGGGGCQDYFHLIQENTEIAACSALYSPLMIKDCFDVAIAVLSGETLDPVVVVPTTIVDASNVAEFLDPNNTIY